MAARGIFIAGTDTGAGKTWVSCALLRALRGNGHRVIGFKPVATGAQRRDGILINDDVDRIAANSDKIGQIEPRTEYLFEPAVSPDIAAEMAGIFIDPAVILARYQELAARSDVVVVEGTGGWLCPIGARSTMADVASALQLPVLLVVGLKLGCINHALLTIEAIRSRGCRLAGWVGNRIDPGYLLPDASLATLSRVLDAPPLAVFEHTDRGCEAATYPARALGEVLFPHVA